MSGPQKPLVAVIGTTGTGKSQLAVELAIAISKGVSGLKPWKGGRAINADAMQVYEGLDIVTNKITPEEMLGVPHRLMDFKSPEEEYFVSQWVKDAVEEIEDCHRSNDVPIVVGGTTYWIQHLIFPNRLVSLEDSESSSDAAESPSETPLSPALHAIISGMPPELQSLWSNMPSRNSSESCSPELAFQLHNLLSRLDPAMGSRWHWKDTRKVLRSLEVIKETGQRASEIIQEQDAFVGKSRYPTLIFWLYAEPESLNPRLDTRIDKMIEKGMLHEIRTTRESAAPSDNEGASSPIDYTQGIFQTIGFKEFDGYLSSGNTSEVLLQQSLDRMKHSTRKYAQRQVKWIRNKLLPVIRAQDEHRESFIYLLDATNIDHWRSNVQEAAIEILGDFLHNRPMRDPAHLSPNAAAMLAGDRVVGSSTEILAARTKVICEVCTTDSNQPVMIEEGEQWRAHAKSRAHRNRAGRERRIAEQMGAREEKRRQRALLNGNDTLTIGNTST